MRCFAPLAALSLSACMATPEEGSRVLDAPGAPTVTPADAQHRPNRVSVAVGSRVLEDEDVWDRVTDEWVLGLEYARVGASGFGFEIGSQASARFQERVSENVQVTGAVIEVYGGLRQEFQVGSWRPYIGAGGALIAAGIDNDSGGSVADEEDSSAAFYGHAGVVIDLSPSAFFGVDVRALMGSSLDFETIESDADYRQLTLVLGTRF